MANSISYTAADLLLRVHEAIDTLEYPLARAFCSRALKLEPNNVEALELAGQVDIELEDLREAKEHFSKAVALQPSTGFSKFMYLGQLSSELEAVYNFQRGVDLMTEERSRLSAESEEAQTLARRISSALVSMTEIYLTDCCFEPDAEQKCESYLQQATFIDPTNPEVYQTLASVRLSQQREDDAREALDRSMRLWVDLEPGDSAIPLYDTRIALVKMLLEMRLYAQAFSVLERLQKENDQVADVWYLYGWAYYCQGNEEEGGEEERNSLWADARECLETALNLCNQQQSDDEGILEHSKELIQKIDEVVPRDDDEEDEGDGDGEDEVALEVDDDEEMVM